MYLNTKSKFSLNIILFEQKKKKITIIYIKLLTEYISDGLYI